MKDARVYQKVIESMPDGVVLVDREGVILLVNPQLEVLSGYAADELVGHSVEVLVPEVLRGQHRDHREQYMGTGAPSRPMGTNLDIHLQRKDGTSLPVDISLSPLEGEPLVVAAVRDASVRRIADAALRESERRFAVVADRERIAKELHDGAIQSLFSVGMRLQASLALAGDAARVRASVDDAILAIDSVIRGLREYIFELERPAESIPRSLERLAAEFPADGVRIVVDVDPEAAKAISSPPVLIQAAREALANAMRHSRAREVSMTLAIEENHVVFEVRDDGVGFDPGGVQGPGRGLKNLKARAEALGGSLYLRSSPGAGTGVRIEIPVEGSGGDDVS